MRGEVRNANEKRHHLQSMYHSLIYYRVDTGSHITEYLDLLHGEMISMLLSVLRAVLFDKETISAS